MSLIWPRTSIGIAGGVEVSAPLPETWVPVMENLTRNGFENTDRNKGRMA